MGRIPDITQHVARRVRVTRMFLKLSLDEVSATLGVPVWLLSGKENGLLHFSLQEFLDLERLFHISWRVFFQDYPETEAADEPVKTCFDPGKMANAIAHYLALAEREASAMDAYPQDVVFSLAPMTDMALEASAGPRPWAPVFSIASPAA